MRGKNRNSIADCLKLPQFTTMNVIDGQADLVIYSSLIFYSLTINNILNIIVLMILAGVSIATLSGDSGLLGKAKTSRDEMEKEAAIEKMTLKINSAQVKILSQSSSALSLQTLADELCEDGEVEYVELKGSAQASLEKITVGATDSILVKLLQYPYEMEIDNTLEIVETRNVEVASPSNNTPHTHTAACYGNHQFRCTNVSVVAFEGVTVSFVCNTCGQTAQYVNTSSNVLQSYWTEGEVYTASVEDNVLKITSNNPNLYEINLTGANQSLQCLTCGQE